MMHCQHLADYYRWRARGDLPARDRIITDNLIFEYSQAARDARFAATFFRW